MDETVRERIKEIIAYAEAHPMTKDDLKEIIDGKKRPAGDNKNHTMIIFNHYRVVYSQEIQLDGKRYHHLSVSVPKRAQGKMPAVEAVELIMQEFGMGDNVHDCREIWNEDNAINILKKVEES